MYGLGRGQIRLLILCGCLCGRLVDNRAFAFAVAKALVTDIEKLRRASPNGQLQPNDILNYFAGDLKVCPFSYFFGFPDVRPSSENIIILCCHSMCSLLHVQTVGLYMAHLLCKSVIFGHWIFSVVQHSV